MHLYANRTLSLLALSVLPAFAILGGRAGGPIEDGVRWERYERSLPRAAGKVAADNPALSEFLDASLAPFYHGVASGDPLQDRVILWTRITPEAMGTDSLELSYLVSTTSGFADVVTSGTVKTHADRDYTVKVDATGLQPATTYYFRFVYGADSSTIGRTRTTPQGGTEALRFGVVSCSNYQAGYFNAYDKLAQRSDLDAIIHLGDYFYEYGTGGYGYRDSIGRGHLPDNEIVTLEDYRTRHSYYKLDPMLRSAHQQHPWIVVWDDHESSNDAWVGGAENHDPDSGEGDWNLRKQASKKAYFEWMPVRESQEDETRLYRKLSYGELAEFFMLDTRLEGRNQQVQSVADPLLLDSNRTMLGQAQREWLLQGLSQSTATWKIIGNQVIFSPLNVGFAAGFGDGQPDLTNLDSIQAVESIFLDIWDGYPVERSRIINHIKQDSILNTVFLTGDFHSAFAFDVVDTPVVYPNPAALNLPTPSGYNPATGSGSVGVEFAVASVTSANFDENVGAAASAQFELSMNNPITLPNQMQVNYNPHMKYVDLDRHGYYVLSLDSGKAQADFWFLSTIHAPEATQAVDPNGSWTTLRDRNHLTMASAPYPEGQGRNPAPISIRDGIRAPTGQAALVLLGGGWQNGSGYAVLHFALGESQEVGVQMLDIKGRVLKQVDKQSMAAGLYKLQLEMEKPARGRYLLRLEAGEGTTSLPISVP